LVIGATFFWLFRVRNHRVEQLTWLVVERDLFVGNTWDSLVWLTVPSVSSSGDTSLLRSVKTKEETMVSKKLSLLGSLALLLPVAVCAAVEDDSPVLLRRRLDHKKKYQDTELFKKVEEKTAEVDQFWYQVLEDFSVRTKSPVAPVLPPTVAPTRYVAPVAPPPPTAAPSAVQPTASPTNDPVATLCRRQFRSCIGLCLVAVSEDEWDPIGLPVDGDNAGDAW
jgi:hypothetical protein